MQIFRAGDRGQQDLQIDDQSISSQAKPLFAKILRCLADEKHNSPQIFKRRHDAFLGSETKKNRKLSFSFPEHLKGCSDPGASCNPSFGGCNDN